MNSDDRSDESDNRPTFEEFTWQDLFSDDPSLLSAADDHPCGKHWWLNFVKLNCAKNISMYLVLL